jgi:hypothetical protein
VSPVELDFLRSKLLELSRDLRACIFMQRYEYDFTGRQSCAPTAPCPIKEPCTVHRLEKLQWRFDELRALYVTTKSQSRLRELARVLPRIADILSRASTGWRDHRGNVHRYAVLNPDLQPDDDFGGTCPHGRRWDQPCRRCKADDAETDAL